MAQRIAFIVGLAFWLPLLRGEFFAGHFFWPVQSPFAPLAFNASTLMVGLGIAIARTPAERLLRLHPTWVAATSAVGAALLLPFANTSQIFATPFTAIAMVGIAAAFCTLSAAWGVACVRLHPAAQSHALVLDVALAYTLSYMTAIPEIAAMSPGGVRSICLIISGCALYAYASMVPVVVDASGFSPHDPNRGSAMSRAVSREVKLLIAAYVMILVLSGLLVGIFVPAGYVGSSSPARSLISFVTALALVALTLPATHRAPDATPLFGGAILILAGTLLTMSGVKPLVAIGSHILTAGRRFLWLLLWILLARTCITTRLHPLVALGCIFPCAFALARVPVNVLRIVDPAQYLSAGALYMVSTWLSVLIMGCVMVLVWLEALRWRNERKAGTAAQLDSESLRSRASLELASSHGLTERERATLELLSRGYTVKRIADELCVSENTVRAHTKAIYRKVGCHSKQELVDLVEKHMAVG